MSGGVITSAEQVTLAWLSQALRDSGALQAGSVTGLDVEPSGSTWSRILRITPHYDPSARGQLPRALLLKICSGAHAVFGDSEVLYYTRDYLGHAAAPLPRCFGAAFDHQSQGYHLLLEDLSLTHCDAWELPKSREHGCAVATAVARLHAQRWGSSGLAELGRKIAGDAEFGRYFRHVRGGLEPLFDTLGGELPPTWRAALNESFEQHERVMQQRAQRDVGFALVHGDVNPGNILAPRSGFEPVYLIDRQPFAWSLQCWLGASDLAYLMVLFWDPAQRRAWQFDVLRHYLATLHQQGIPLSWEQLLWDYRLSVVQALELAVEWLVLPEDRLAKRWLWERQLHNAINAYFELKCQELWTEDPSRELSGAQLSQDATAPVGASGGWVVRGATTRTIFRAHERKLHSGAQRRRCHSAIFA